MTGDSQVSELITDGPARALAGLLGVPMPDLAAGQGLPPLWHWVYLLERPPQAVLGPDGHPARDAVPVPPGPGLHRMFAGGRLRQHRPLRTGAPATRRTWQAGAVHKKGRSGPLHFITVRTDISQSGQVVISEEQDLVYREPPPPGGPAASETRPPGPRAQPSLDPGPQPPAAPGAQPPPDGAGDWVVPVDPVLLFRFSALIYNAHRIHYDLDYARAEGYRGLVVHGPLQALLMAELARRDAGTPARCDYSYRLIAPLFDHQGLIVSAAAQAHPVQVSTRDATGRTTATGVIDLGGASAS